MQVSHPKVDLRLDAWRDALESTLASATQILEEELLFEAKYLGIPSNT